MVNLFTILLLVLTTLSVTDVFGGDPPEKPLTVTAHKPKTVEIKLDEDTKTCLTDSGKSELQLILKGVRGNENADFRVRVFINNIKATQETTIDSTGYVGTFILSHDDTTETDFILNPTKAVSKLKAAKEMDMAQPLTVTLVLVPLREGKSLAADTKLTFKDLEIKKAKQ